MPDGVFIQSKEGIGTRRILGRATAPAMASASIQSFLFAFTYGFTYRAGISRSWWPRDRRALPASTNKILSLYARGMATRAIQGHLEEMHQVEVSPASISNVTEAVLEEVKAWQARPLDEVCPIVLGHAGDEDARGWTGGELRRVHVHRGHARRHKGGSGPLDLSRRGHEVLALGAQRSRSDRAQCRGPRRIP